MSSCRFLSLPRELRDMIYEKYFAIDGGYLCDTDAFLKGSLATSAGQPVDLALVYTCKAVAQETENGNIALRFNTVTFTTLYSPELGHLAQLFQKLMFDGVWFVKGVMFNAVGHYLSKESVSELKSCYPQFAPLLRRLKAEDPVTGDELLQLTGGRCGPYGEPPSVYREFLDITLRLAADDPEASLAIRDFVVPWNSWLRGDDELPVGLEEYQRRKLRSGFDFIDNRTEIWEVPSPSDLDELIRLTKYTVNPICPEAEVKYRFSAAAAAIYFLKSMSPQTCCHLRKLVVLEDRRSVCDPESHAVGLIPFCQDYPHLRVERRVKLFRNVFLQGVTYDGDVERDWVQEFGHPPEGELFSESLTYTLAPWIIEASRLAEAGMPADSFSLLLDSDGANQLATEIFYSIINRDVEWQEAWVESLAASQLSWFDRRGEVFSNLVHDTPHFNYFATSGNPEEELSAFADVALHGGQIYSFENFPRAIRGIADGTSVVRGDFDTGLIGPNPHAVLDDRSDWDNDTWQNAWHHYYTPVWRTERPLPNWSSIVRDEIIRPWAAGSVEIQ